MKTWYDKTARDWSFPSEEMTLVLLLSDCSKLEAAWQGQYATEDKLSGRNYKINMHDRKKKSRVFYINMFAKCESPTEACLVASCWEEREHHWPGAT